MSADKSNQKIARLQVLRDKDAGRVFPAGPVSVAAMGEDAPREFRLVLGDGQVREEIELSDEQARMSPQEL